MAKILGLILWGFFYSQSGQATVYVGAGHSTVTRGRPIGMAYLGVDFGKFGISASSLGFNSSLYYASYYNAHWFWVLNKINFLGGTLHPSVGVGFHYNKLGYRESTTATVQEKANIQFGPSFRVVQTYGFLFFGMENLWGLNGTQRQLTKITLTPAHINSLILGVFF